MGDTATLHGPPMAQTSRPAGDTACDNRPGLWRRLRLFGAFLRIGLIEHLRSVAMILLTIAWPWIALIYLVPFAMTDRGMGDPPGLNLARIVDGAQSADERLLRDTIRQIDWADTRRLSADVAQKRFDSGVFDAMVRMPPPAADAEPGSPAVVELQVRNPDDPLWAVLEARLEAPPPTARAERAVVLAPVALRDDGPRPGPYAGFFAVMLVLTAMGVAVHVLGDRLDEWERFLRVAPMPPALALSGMSGGRLVLSIVGMVYQWYAIEWTIGWPHAIDAAAVAGGLALGLALAWLLGTAYALSVPAYHGAKESAPQAMILLALLLPLFWSPGDLLWAQGLALINPMMPILDLLRHGFGAAPILLAPGAALAVVAGWLVLFTLAIVWASRRAFRPARAR